MPEIGRGQKAALLEAYTATVSLLPSSLRTEFPIIGGTALIILGSTRISVDVDFAVSATALIAFSIAAANDPRFLKGAVDDWTYICQGEGIHDINVPLEFLQMDGGFVPSIKVVKPAGEGFRASLGELARMKANAYAARDDVKDRDDFEFLLRKMEETAEGFEGVELQEEDLENIEAAAVDCSSKPVNLLKRLLKESGHQ